MHWLLLFIWSCCCARIVRLLSRPIVRLLHLPWPAARLQKPSTEAKVVELPVEIWDQIVAFSNTQTIVDRLVFVSRTFALLSFPVLRKRFAASPSTWIKEFEDPWLNSSIFNSNLERKKVQLQYAHLTSTNGLPYLYGCIQVAPFDSDSHRRSSLRIPPRLDFFIEIQGYRSNEGFTITHAENVFRVELPRDSGVSSELNFTIRYTTSEGKTFEDGPYILNSGRYRKKQSRIWAYLHQAYRMMMNYG